MKGDIIRNIRVHLQRNLKIVKQKLSKTNIIIKFKVF